MRALVAMLLLVGCCGWTVAADDKLTEKFLIGKWNIKEVGVRTPDDKAVRWIEFKPRGVYEMNDRGTKSDGTYKLKGTTLDLRDKASGAVVTWKDLTIKDGKITHPLGRKGPARAELTRVKEEKEEKQ